MGLDVSELVEMARRCRINIVRMTHEAGAGHPGGSLSAIDLLVALYGTELSIDRHDSEWDDRDRFIMSKGHASPAVYSILHEVGYLSEDDLMSFRSMGSVCQGHVDRSGPMGSISLQEVWEWGSPSGSDARSLLRWTAVIGTSG